MSDIDNIRLLISDPIGPNTIWLDSELSYFLQIAGNIDFLAAAYALEAEASDAARMTERIHIGDFGTDESEVYQALLARAANLRAQAPIAPVFNAPNQIFYVQDSCGEPTIW